MHQHTILVLTVWELVLVDVVLLLVGLIPKQDVTPYVKIHHVDLIVMQVVEAIIVVVIAKVIVEDMARVLVDVSLIVLGWPLVIFYIIFNTNMNKIK